MTAIRLLVLGAVRRRDAGILTAATDLLFSGGREGYFYALDARSGALLWKASVGGQIAAAPISYQVDRQQYVVIAAGHSLFAMRLMSKRLDRGACRRRV